jgi:hypothetical protein
MSITSFLRHFAWRTRYRQAYTVRHVKARGLDQLKHTAQAVAYYRTPHPKLRPRDGKE